MHASDHPADERAAEALRDRRRAGLEAVAVGGLIATVVFTAIVGVWGFARQSLETHYRAQLTALAQAAALQVNPELHRSLRSGGEDKALEYLWTIEPLRRMQAGVPGIRFVHTLALDGDQVRVILDAAEDFDQDDDSAVDQSQFSDVGAKRQRAMLKALGWQGAAPEAGATDGPFTDGRGAFMTGYAPFFDGSGHLEGVVAVDFDAVDYIDHLAEGRQRMVRGLLPAALLVLLLTYGMFVIRWRALGASREVAQGADVALLAARQDKLTGLANRTAFVERLQLMVTGTGAGTGKSFAVLFLDFDHFKHVNDTLGHDAGDELLRQIAIRLRKALATETATGRAGVDHLAARFGGDEFVILLDDVRDAAEARAAADRLIVALAPFYTLRGVEVTSTASIGIALSGVAGDDAESLLHNADVAMYEAKHSGRGCYVMFDEVMRSRITRVLELERSLMKAIGTPQLRLAYQPIVELDSGRMVAVEALLRWDHPTLGEVPPADFLPMAEETGLIVPLGDWVMQEACRQLAEWQRLDPVRAPETVSVNLSGGELALGMRLVERVRGALERAQLAARSLQLEVAEGDMVRDRVAATALMQQLRVVGVRLAMDEFGTGPASLSALRAYQFDSVKVARSFVHGLASSRDVMALAHATLTLVENLGMSSVAQGVEEPAQLAILQSLGCRYAQGRLLGAPLEADKVLDATTTSRIEDPNLADSLLSSASAA
jgi:diguanylate cyclase (GGDEF)-like protein